ncbi:MAG: hotdog fold thioesterase [Verrucomicrobiota bacterium]
MSVETIKELVRKNDRLGKLLGVELVEVREGYAETRLEIGPQHLNAANVAHGGAVFSLADIALAGASNSYGNVALLTNGNLTVFHGTKEGDTLTACAEEVSKSRKLAHYRVVVSNGEGEKIAVFTASVYRTSVPLTTQD